jgi:hypothetical protein
MSNDSEYEKLKTFCDQNGFDVINESGEFSNFFLVVNKKKDIWEGVEFVDCVDGDGSLISPRKIYKVLNNLPGEPSINIRIVDNKLVELSINKKWFKPSTEESYVNQLKAKAFELYGEIKDGDRFEDWGGIKFEISDTVFKYKNEKNALYVGRWLIYLNGQWAKKLPKRIEVQTGAMIRIPQIQHTYGMSFTFNSDVKLSYEHHAFLNKQLEKYLNEEIETP